MVKHGNMFDMALTAFCNANNVNPKNIDLSRGLSKSVIEKLEKPEKDYSATIEDYKKLIESGNYSKEDADDIVGIALLRLGYELNDETKALQDNGHTEMTSEAIIDLLNANKKGLETLKRSDPNDMTFLGATKDVQAFYATHGYRYCDHIDTESVVSENGRKICSKHKVYGEYVVDCSTAVEAAMYEYAKANGCQVAMEAFHNEKWYSGSFVREAEMAEKGKSRFFDSVPTNKSELRAGDILAVNGHVEIFSHIDKNGVIYVYNAGGDESVASAEPTKSGHKFSNYKVIRPKSAEELKALDEGI